MAVPRLRRDGASVTMTPFDINDLYIRAVEMDVILRNANLLSTVRRLTIDSGSGMNMALNYYQTLIQSRSVNAHGVLGYHGSLAIGWALVTRESDRFSFKERAGHACIQVYVLPTFRRKGVGCALVKSATELYEDTFNVYHWSNPEFFSLFMGEKNFKSV